MKEHQHRGLTSAQVEESRRLHGDNLITPRKGDSAWKLFAEKFRDPIIQVLLVAALLSLAMAFIDGEFTLKRFHVDTNEGCAWLMPANADFKPIKVTEENNFMVWGVMTFCIRRFHE